MVGFNRRFAPLVAHVKQNFPSDSIKAIQYRINAGAVPPEHWAHDPDVGGGRVVGEVCHFVDLARFLVGHPIVSVSAAALTAAHALQDSISVSLGFGDGSIASISYFSNGNKRLGKERLEVFSAGRVAVLDDFRELKIFGERTTTQRIRVADKGHAAEVAAFLESVRKGWPSPIPLAEICESMHATFQIRESLRTRRTIALT
jgi:polar amino acid transport system substrate-binding protein